MCDDGQVAAAWPVCDFLLALAMRLLLPKTLVSTSPLYCSLDYFDLRSTTTKKNLSRREEAEEAEGVSSFRNLVLLVVSDQSSEI